LQISVVSEVGCITAALTWISIEKYHVKIGRFVLKYNGPDVSASEIQLLGLKNVERSTANFKPGPQHEQEKTNQTSSYVNRQEKWWGDKGGFKQA
jgi:hypothetical protein